MRTREEEEEEGVTQVGGENEGRSKSSSQVSMT